MFAYILCLQLCQSVFSMLSYEMMTNVLFSSLKLRLWNDASAVSIYILCLKKQCAFWSLTCDEIFISLFSSFFTFFLFTIKSLTSTFFKKELKEYVITIHKCDKSKLSEWQFFFDLIKAECVHMHTSSFNLKKFSIMNW